MPKKARILPGISVIYIYILNWTCKKLILLLRIFAPNLFLSQSSYDKFCRKDMHNLSACEPSSFQSTNLQLPPLLSGKKKHFSSEFKCTIWNIIFFYFLFQSLRNERVTWGDVGKEFKERKREDKLFHKPCCLFLENHQQTKYLVIHFDNGQSRNW